MNNHNNISLKNAKKIKELDDFLKKNNIELRGEVYISFYNKRNVRSSTHTINCSLGITGTTESFVEPIVTTSIASGYWAFRDGKIKDYSK